MRRFAAILCTAAVLAGCTDDPLQGVPRLSQTDVSDSDIQAAIRADPQATEIAGSADPEDAQPGLFAGLFRRPTASAAEPTPDDTPGQTALDTSEDVVAADTAEPARTGLLGFLRRAADEARAPTPDRDVTLAALPPETTTGAPSGGGLFGGGANAGPDPSAPDYRIVEMGTTLPYGILARVCNVPNRQLGTRVDRYPENRNTYALYDSQPGNTAPHTYFVTGFKDGCARQFTAALAVFGSPETHEQLRYGLPSKVQPYSQTDAAYEKLKSRICRVGRGKPCGSSMSRLARDTVFVSVYERFGSNPIWKTILLHDGEVVETDIRGN